MSKENSSESISSNETKKFAIGFALIISSGIIIGYGHVIIGIIIFVFGTLLATSAGEGTPLENMFDDGLDPGSDKLNPCPSCGEDKIRRIGTKIYRPNKYVCDDCGYKASKEEAERSLTDSMLASVGDEVPTLGNIENEELREEVSDRLIEGWEIDKVDNEKGKVVLKTTKGGTIGGHAITGLATGLWTFGAGNVVYNKMSKGKNSERMVLREKKNMPDDTDKITKIPDVSSKIRDLKELSDDDIITDEEFKKKKKELLEEY